MDSEPHFTRSHGAGVLSSSKDLDTEGFLLVPSQLPQRAFQEVVQLLKDRSRRITFVGTSEVGIDSRILGEVQSAGGLVILKAETVKAELVKATSDGGVALFVPQQCLMRPGGSVSTPHEVLIDLLATGTRTVPLFVMIAAEHRLGADSGSGEPEIYLSVMDALHGDRVTLPALQEAILLGGEWAFSKKPFLNGHLGRALISGIKRHGTKASLVDGNDGSELRYDKVLAAALALVPLIKKETDKEHVAVVLPPGKGAVIANLAIMLAGRVPVNINFTASHDAIDSAIRQSDIDKFITADPFVRRMSSFPWPPNRDLILLERVVIGLKPQIGKWLALSKILPASVLGNILKLPKDSGDERATIIFTSGSSGEPKGVPLTHRNILANCTQFGTRLSLDPDSDKGLGCLPFFHSFGFTVTLWYPLLEGIPWVFYPNPMEAPKLGELVHKHRCTLLLSTATFLRGFFRRVKREHLATLKYTVVGAEKLPVKVAEIYKEKFGKDVYEGYGLTETSPATNFNLPDPESDDPDMRLVPSFRLGTVGHPVSGLAVRIANPDSGEFQPVDQSGIVCVKGANVFRGYYKNPAKSKEVIRDGWFHTGDIGRIDVDGMLIIEGRLSRFSKIAGEMVPHETLEDYVVRAQGLDGETERKIAITSVPDDKKGEAIVLLSTICGETLSQEVIDLRYSLIDLGLPSLWTPKQIIPVETIPVLASGKLDIQGCQRLADEAMGIERG